MSIKENKIKLLKKLYNYSEKLLSICNEIEKNFYYNNIDLYYYNLNPIHSEIENTFNFKLFSEYYNIIDTKNINNFSYVYKNLNNYIDILENIIKIYSKYIKNNILLYHVIKNLNLNTKINNIHEYFLNYTTYKIYNFFI